MTAAAGTHRRYKGERRNAPTPAARKQAAEVDAWVGRQVAQAPPMTVEQAHRSAALIAAAQQQTGT